MTDHPQPQAPPHPEDWVPVERRVFGIDRRTIAPALGVLVFMVLMAVGLPAIDESVDYDDPIAASDVMDLVGGKLTLVPAEGWNRVDGSLVGEGAPEAVGSVSAVAIEDISVSVTTGKFDGTPDELLDQINELNEDLEDPRGLGAAGPRQEVTTPGGLTGVAETFTGLDERGVAAAFVVDVDGTSVGVEVVVRGSVESMGDHFEEITTMLDSMSLKGGDDSEAGS
ncbi:MAG: hypothetical protein M5U19_13355 [Microthrixaceae bacterium]|nr:hypothetical protein [Microthrixaceae bacterium]